MLAQPTPRARGLDHKQGSQPITAHRPSYGRCSLAKAPRAARTRSFSFPSWLTSSILVITLLSSLCPITQSESLATSCIKPPEAEQKCNKETGGCEELTMGHTESPEYHHLQTLLATTERLWVFGYGSLVWKTGFDYTSKKTGYIDGFVRRFWQGDTTHRGTRSSPGRVATLEKEESGLVWGVAFELEGREQIETALEHLGMRECSLGGYDMHLVPFYSHSNNKDNNNNNDDDITNTEPIDTLVFLASPGNMNYLGRASIEDLTDQIISSKGNAGHNVEYVTRLAEFMRDTLPSWIYDNHLEELDSSLRRELRQRNIDLEVLLAMETQGYSYMYQKEESDHANEESVNEDQNVNTLTTDKQSKGDLDSVKGTLELNSGFDSNSNSIGLSSEDRIQSRKRKLSIQESTEHVKSRPNDHTSEL